MSCHITVLISCWNRLIALISFLQVKTQLENPTRYFIAQKQKRQLKEYLKTQGSPSGAGDLIMTSVSQPTLNAINQQAVAALASGHLMGQPESPMAVMSPEGNNTSDVSTIEYINIQQLNF